MILKNAKKGVSGPVISPDTNNQIEDGGLKNKQVENGGLEPQRVLKHPQNRVHLGV
jgi:hypothetical protein